LFDFSIDPYQKNDLSAKHPDLETEILKALANQKELDIDAFPNDLN
jgi:hypothetical protein